MDTVLYAEINIFSIAVLLVIAFKSSMTEMEQPLKNKLFSFSVWFVTAANVFDLLWKLSNTKYWTLPLPVTLGINFMYFMCFGLSSYFWFLYSEVTAKKDILRRARLIGEAFPLFVLVGLLIVSMFNGCLFYFDENMEYHRGPLYYLQGILSYGYIGIASVKSLIEVGKKKNYSHKEELFTVASFSVPLLLCGAAQLFFQSAPVMTLGVSAAYLIVYINSLQILISIDSLTGLNNRRELLKHLEEKVLALKKDENLYFLFIDLDSFKQINDKYGHNEGDRALKAVASVLKSVCGRTGGFCARYGGDEFAVVQVLETGGNIDDVRKEICELIERKSTEQALAYNISVSVGYAEYPKRAKNIQDLIYCADSDMYDVKMRKKQAR